MFIACPHCRYLVATDPRTQTPPAHCTRCGGALGEASAAAPENTAAAGDTQSFASLLRHDEVVVASTSVETQVQADDDAVPSREEATADPVTLDDAEAPMQDIARDAESPAQDEPAIVQETNVAPPASAVAAVQRNTARAPGFLRAGAAVAGAPRRVPRWQWLSVVVLVLALVLQMLLADRARLAADAGWRPVVVNLCKALACSIPAWREPQAFVMLDRDVRPLPGAAGVLQARATFRNDARWSQPWPILLLTLKDADGRNLGTRAITPTEYLRGGAANRELAPGQSAQVAVHIREPSANVVAFSFDFR